jgi:hypothetical protein
MKTLIALFLLALNAAAQDDDTPAQRVSIDGTVVEAGTGIPVAGATVALHLLTSNPALDSVVAPADGTFHFAVAEPGRYALTVTAPGFAETDFRGDGAGILLGEAEFRTGAEAVVHKAELRLSRAGALTGRVVDAESQKPISSVMVRALRYWWLRGSRQLSEERTGYTDDDGQFRLGDLRSGEYLLEVYKAEAGNFRQAGAGGKQYPLMVLPGNDPDSVHPFGVPEGGAVNAGVISYRKIEPALVALTVNADCEPQPHSALWLEQRIGGAGIGRLSSWSGGCRNPMPIPSAPGTYRVLFLARDAPCVPSQQCNNVTATPAPGSSVQISVVSRHISVGSADITVTEGVPVDAGMSLADAPVITGHIICECQKPLRLHDGELALRILPLALSGLITRAEVRADSSFAGVAAFAGAGRILIEGLPGNLTIKGISVNGIDTGPFFTATPGSASAIEITLSDSPATITGAVVREDKPAPLEHVVLAAWPLRVVMGYPEFQSADAGVNGEFILQNIPPGKYRIVSVGEAEWAQRDSPGIIAGLLAGGDEISIGPKENGTVRVQARKPQ